MYYIPNSLQKLRNRYDVILLAYKKYAKMPSEAVKTYRFLICIQYHTNAYVLLEIEIFVAKCLLHSYSAS